MDLISSIFCSLFSQKLITLLTAPYSKITLTLWPSESHFYFTTFTILQQSWRLQTSYWFSVGSFNFQPHARCNKKPTKFVYPFTELNIFSSSLNKDVSQRKYWKQYSLSVCLIFFFTVILSDHFYKKGLRLI